MSYYLLFVTLTSNNVTKSPLPPKNAPPIAAKAIEVSIVRSFFGSIPFCFNHHSKIISGIPPALPPITLLPFISAKEKSL